MGHNGRFSISTAARHFSRYLCRVRAIGIRLIAQRDALVQQEVITPTIGPERSVSRTFGRRRVGAVTVQPKGGPLALSPIGQHSKGAGWDGVIVSAGVVPDVDFLGFARAVVAGEGPDLERKSAGAEGEERKGLSEMHGCCCWVDRGWISAR